MLICVTHLLLADGINSTGTAKSDSCTQLTPGNKSYYITRVGVILGKLCKLLTAQSHVGITLRGSSITLELYNRKIKISPFALVDELSATWRRPAGNCWTWWRCSAHRRWPIKSRCCWVRKRRRPSHTNCSLIWKWKIEKNKKQKWREI
jgi:hypothetical protein